MSTAIPAVRALAPLSLALLAALAAPARADAGTDAGEHGHHEHDATLHAEHHGPRPDGTEALPYAPTLAAIVVTSEAPVSPLTWVTDPGLPRQPVPASDGADYLRTIPGFSLVRNGGSNGDPVLRGMFGSRLNLLSNDGTMPGACPGRMDNAMSYVAPETYDRLTVIKGPQTVLWGPGASAGTVRFERTPELFEEPGARLDGSLMFGSFGRRDQVLDAALGSPTGYLRFGGNRSESDDYRDGDGRTVASAWKKWNADVALGWTPSADTLLELSAGTGDGEARYATRQMDGTRFERESYGLRFRHERAEGVLARVEANLFHNTADHLMDNYGLRDPYPDGPMPMPMASNVERRSRGGRVALSWRLPGVELVTGVDTQDSRHRSRHGMGRDTWQALPWLADAQFDQLGLFAEATWHMSEERRLVAGLRGDRAEVQDLRSTIGMGKGMSMPNPTAGLTREEDLASGFLRLEQDFAEGRGGWFAGIGRVERMPDYWELFSPQHGPAGEINAFAGVRPEVTTQLDVGLQVRGERLDAWVSAYAGRIEDYILFTWSSGGMMGSMTTVGQVDADIHGAEAGLKFRPRQNWRLGGSLAWAWGEQRGHPLPLPQMPPLEARLEAAYDTGQWSVGALLRAAARQDRIAPDQGNVVGRDLGESPGFATLALNGSWRVNSRLKLSAGVDNLFDRRYSEHLNLAGVADFGWPADPVRITEPGRLLWLKLDLAY